MTQLPRLWDGVALREGDFPNRQPPVRALPSGTSHRAVPTLVRPYMDDSRGTQHLSDLLGTPQARS